MGSLLLGILVNIGLRRGYSPLYSARALCMHPMLTRNMSCLLQLIPSFCILHTILVEIPQDNDWRCHWRFTGLQSCEYHFHGSGTHSDLHVQTTYCTRWVCALMR